MEDLLEELNDQQREAVLAVDGPVLVLAGAGSGKTKALTHRIAYLIREKKVSPYKILAVTFTNKAAAEMATRVSTLLSNRTNDVSSIDGRILTPDQVRGKLQQFGVPQDDSNKEASATNNSTIQQFNNLGLIRLPWLGTFHSICVRILRREAQYIGYQRSFTIYDDGDQLSIIKRIMRDLSIDPKHYAPQAIRSFISGAKNELISAEEYKKYNSSPFEVMTSKVFERYEKYLREVNAMDFDDLIGNCVKLFNENPKVLERYQSQFKYILIDEYQDTNQAQYLWVKLLAEKHQNIMVVGDDYQSIYSWRGANFRNILNFERDYKNAQVIKLEQNYRSTQVILNAANEVIKYNRNRTDKKLWTENHEGAPITIYEALNEKDEAEFVATELVSLLRRNQNEGDGSKTTYSDFAVLYRTNAQSRAIEEAFLRFNIPYRVVGGIRFYERKEIKDMIAYLRLIINPNDFEALSRIVVAPPRGIGEKTLLSISGTNYLCSEEELVSLPKKVQEFYKIMREIYHFSADCDLPALIEHIGVKTGFKGYLLDGTPEGEGRWENILELITVASQATSQRDEEEFGYQSDLERFLEQVALVQDTDDIDKGTNVVTLMTLHSAQGLA